MQENKDQAHQSLTFFCFWNKAEKLKALGSENNILLSEFFSTRAVCRFMVYYFDNFASNYEVLCEAGLSQLTCMTQLQLRLFGHVARFTDPDLVSSLTLWEIIRVWRSTTNSEIAS